MNAYASTINLAQTAAALRQAQRVVITTHTKPDGDAFGSVVALTAMLRGLGKTVTPLFMPPVPASFQTLRGAETAAIHAEGSALPEADLYVIVDTGAWAQISPMRADMEQVLDRTLIIDHHISGDIAARMRYVDAQAAACCEVVADIADAMSVDIADPTMAEALFVGIASDTGWFRFSNTRPRTHALASRLLHCGVDHAALYAKLEQTERVQKLRLMIRALDSLELICGERAAVMVLRREDFAQTGALLEETERFVDAPQAVSTVQVVVLITEPPDSNGNGDAKSTSGQAGGSSTIRISFRSKPGPNAVNVATLAQAFGGGGHARAAGAKIAIPLDEAVTRVKQAICDIIG